MTKAQPVSPAIETVTLGHYQHNAEAFWHGTKEHDVSQNYAAFLASLPAEQALDILDFGCGPGRDVLHFKNLGHRPVGLDGCAAFCQMANALTGCEVLQQTFLNLDLPPARFDGVFANASLFHVPSVALAQVLNCLHHTLKPHGILFMSNPRGQGEGWSGDRYGNYMELAGYENYLTAAGFRVHDHYYRPAGKPLVEQPWLAIVAARQNNC